MFFWFFVDGCRHGFVGVAFIPKGFEEVLLIGKPGEDPGLDARAVGNDEQVARWGAQDFAETSCLGEILHVEAGPTAAPAACVGAVVGEGYREAAGGVLDVQEALEAGFDDAALKGDTCFKDVAKGLGGFFDEF